MQIFDFVMTEYL